MSDRPECWSPRRIRQAGVFGYGPEYLTGRVIPVEIAHTGQAGVTR